MSSSSRPVPDSELVLGVRHKSVPAGFWGRAAADVAAERHPLSSFSTPLLTLDRAAADHNTAALVAWVRERGLELAPHGKTTMAPVLWRRLLDAGAWGLTLATVWQAQVARAAGVQRILIANEVVDPVAISWVAAEVDAGAEIACWVDSIDGVRVLAESAGMLPLDVLIELGAPGGRTGARGTEAALAVAREVLAAPRLRLRGVAGYEGSYGSDRSDATMARVRAFLRELRELAETLLMWDALSEPIVTAGGSAYFELVAEELGSLADSAAGSAGRSVTVVLRSGAFQAHDEVFYDGISPFHGSALEFRPALALWSRVVSRPEPTLVILDAGKRDAPIDLGVPVVHGHPGAVVTALNDQHAYVAIPASSTLAVGNVVRLGISHPCTAFDKWRLLPELETAVAPDPVVIGFVETFF